MHICYFSPLICHKNVEVWAFILLLYFVEFVAKYAIKGKCKMNKVCSLKMT